MKKIDYLAIFRLVAFFILIFHHCIQVIPITDAENILKIGTINFSWLINGSSTCGMWILYVLSGYLMGKIFFMEKYELTFCGIKNFIWNRALRIIPQYYFYLISMLVLGYITLSNLTPFKEALVFRYNNGGAIPHMWSVTTEVQFYLLVPFFIWLFKKMNKMQSIVLYVTIILATLIARIIGFYSLSGDFNNYLNEIYRPIWYNLDYFICGILLNKFILDKLKNLNAKISIKLSFMVFLIFYLVSSYITYYGCTFQKEILYELHFFFLPIFTIFVTSIMIYLLENLNSAVSENLCGIKAKVLSLLTFWGTISYGIYIWHVQIRDGILNLTAPISYPLIRFLVLVLLTATCSTVVAYITHFGIDKQLEKYKKF